MNQVNKTLYIPLYGKSYVSKRGLFLDDKKAEEIWSAEGFALKGKSRSKWLAFYMGIRAAVFDEWVKRRMEESENAVVIHIGCGMDSRVLRTAPHRHKWYDVDFAEVIAERRRYYTETDRERMLVGDARDGAFLAEISETHRAIVVMEGVSMYLTPEELRTLTEALCAHFNEVALLMDCYTVLAAKLSKYKNPIRDVGVTTVYGMDDPVSLQHSAFAYVGEHAMTPQACIDKLSGIEKRIFGKLYAGRLSKKLYRLFEYKKAEVR